MEDAKEVSDVDKKLNFDRTEGLEIPVFSKLLTGLP